MPQFKKNTSPVMKKSGFKMKGSPMQRNFGLGDVASLLTAPGLGRIKKNVKDAWQKYGPIINQSTKTYDLGFDT